jgi:general secretion pathway protein D
MNPRMNLPQENLCAREVASGAKAFFDLASFRAPLKRGPYPSKRCIALLVLLSLAILLAAAPLAAETSKKLYKLGLQAEAREDYDAAFDYYRQAWTQSPADNRYKATMERLRPEAAFVHLKKGRELRDSADYIGAMTEFLKALAIDPSLEVAHQEIEITRRRMADKAEAAPVADTVAPKAEEIAASEAESPVELKPISNEPLTLHLNEDSKVVYQTIGKQAGLNVLFDSEYTGKRIQVDLTNTTLYDALRIVGAISGTFWKPITPNTIFVATDSRAKRSALDQQAVRTFYLTNPSQQQDLNDVQTALRNVLGEGPKFFSVPSQNAIVARGTPDQLILAEKIIDDLDKPRAEVLLDVSILEVDKDLLRNIGIQLPGSISLTLQAPNASTTTTTGTGAAGSNPTGTDTSSNPTLNEIGKLSAQDFSVSLGTASVNLLLSDSDTKILQDPRIRATDGQKATMKIGSRIPVATGSYSSGASAAAAISPLVQTQFQYLDIGTNIEVTPTIHFDRDVTLKIKIEVLSENGSTTISGVTEPIIGQRSIEHTIRLHEGETNILGGILERTQSKTIGGTPGVGEIPLLKYLFSSQQTETQTYEIVFLLTPHVVRAHEVSPLNQRMIDTGTGNTIELRRSGPEVSADGADGAPAAKPSPSKPLPAKPVALPVPLPATPPAASLVHAPGVAAAATAVAAVPAGITLQLTPPAAPQKVGSTFTVAVKMSGGQDIFSVPMEMQYDPQKLTLINVDNGDLLTRDGQIASLVHRDENGMVHIATSRPQGMKGISGDGTVVVASFIAKAPGETLVAVTQAMPRNSAQQVLPASGASTAVHIQP